MPAPLLISGYVLAGGRSSRMGAEKSLLLLAGKPLIAQAVAKLRRVCADVYILSGNTALAGYAPLVPDLHPGCGPLSGIEAALAHAPHDWVLILPVDVPFLPTVLLETMAAAALGAAPSGRIAFFTVEDRPQPAICLLHKDVASHVALALQLGEFKLFSVLESAAVHLAQKQNLLLEEIVINIKINNDLDGEILAERGGSLTNIQRANRHMWFANLNTPEDFAWAEAHTDAIET